MSNIYHEVLNSEHENRKKNFKNFFWPTYSHFLITYFYCHFENVQPNWLDRSSWNFQDRQRSGFEGCSENFVPIWHLLPLWKCTAKLAGPIELKFSGSDPLRQILHAKKGQKWQWKYVIRTFIVILKVYSQTGWAEWAEIFTTVKGVDRRSDPYGRFYRPIKNEMAIRIRNPKMEISRSEKI